MDGASVYGSSAAVLESCGPRKPPERATVFRSPVPRVEFRYTDRMDQRNNRMTSAKYLPW